MARTMRLLLVLSAFLTALVGVGTPAAAMARPACEVSVAANVRAQRPTSRIASASPQRSGALDRVDFGPIARQDALVRSVPLYAERLRV